MQNELPDGRAPSSPRPPPTSDDIRDQLERVVNSPEFPSVGRSAAFLTYVTGEVLSERGDRIKGYSIAVEVFKRSAAFTQDDPVVRIEAGRLRRALERYYLVAGQNDPIRIDIPKGGYVPTFVWNDGANSINPGDPSLSGPRAQGRRLMPIGAGAALMLCVVMIALMLPAYLLPALPKIPKAQSEGPTLVVAPFANLGDGPKAALYTAGLTEELLTALPRFKEIKVFGRETSTSLPSEVEASQVRDKLGARFLLAGGVRVSDDRVRITARLLDTDTNEILWSQTYDDDTKSGDLFKIQSDVANKVATAVAQPYGIMARADATHPSPDDLGVYGCTLSFYGYRAELSATRHLEVRDCLESAVARYPSFATAWAMLSIIYLDEDRYRFNSNANPAPAIERSLQAARRAVQLDPGNTRAHQALMTALFFNQEVPEALRVGEQALATNPNDTELLGEFGTRVAMSGEWERGAALLDRALALNPGGGGYYHGTRALAAYMLNDDKTSVIEIKQADLQKFPLFHGVAAVIYVNAGMMDEARREALRFNEMRPDFVPNIVAELKARNLQPGDRARLMADLRRAGLPASDEARASMLLPLPGSSVLVPR
ncbi:TolB amino-terminal domain-containing protein [Rhizobium tibeticum]|uniref:Putative O-linked N-acetylglucosamine transferase, SPINDLY family n=1 Tax=Rhizobium tibeticum TaxID=501024 RepID=A0A1H8W8L8_9HYPH|nr:adenylate cyclase [Rhizobium tibeticum]SEI20506.1 putative O-linked N-acetylglucosamine transferase, SPINDLY family [Rhizobium tibeticum]SEP19363.1 TolB amino-terminal domain-containing protein [Rhizobium tibeticum]SEP24016.1 TolB amino-terminal domain-containing protein [Rhizobium tibeticum]